MLSKEKTERNETNKKITKNQFNEIFNGNEWHKMYVAQAIVLARLYWYILHTTHRI